MNCTKIQMAVLAADAEAVLPRDIRRHLADCPACRDFAELQRRVCGQAPRLDPPSHLDRAVTDYARQHAGIGRRDRHLPPPLRLVRWAAAAAAVFLLAAVLLPRWHDRRENAAEGTPLTGVDRLPADAVWEYASLDEDLFLLEVQLAALDTSTAYPAAEPASETDQPEFDTPSRTIDSLEETILDLEIELLLEGPDWGGPDQRSGGSHTDEGRAIS